MYFSLGRFDRPPTSGLVFDYWICGLNLFRPLENYLLHTDNLLPYTFLRLVPGGAMASVLSNALVTPFTPGINMHFQSLDCNWIVLDHMKVQV